ncbi:MAG: sulfotransferase domain-containing protein [Hasllibacter sp.]
MLADFVIIGAMKCGTSTLAAQLSGREGLFVTTPKEPNFFSDDAVHARGLAWYEALFEDAEPGAIKGEASTHYTKITTHPRALERLAAVLEAPRLVYLIRDPVARAVSHYIHEWTMGVMGGDVDAAFEAHPELVDHGRYGMQIEPWAARFGTGRILVSSLEAMKADPQGVLDRVGAFIGHPGPLPWREEDARVNASAERVRRLPMQGLLVDNPVATALRRTLVPQSLRDRIRRSRQMTERPRPSDALVARLRETFAADRARLDALFPGNADIDLAYPFMADR